MNISKNDINDKLNNNIQNDNFLNLHSSRKILNTVSKLHSSEKFKSNNINSNKYKTFGKPTSKSVSFKTLKKENILTNENMKFSKSVFKDYYVQERDKIASRLKVKYCEDSQIIFTEWLSTFTSIFVSYIFLRCSKNLLTPIPTLIVSVCLLQLSLMKKKELTKKSLETKKLMKIKDVDKFLEQVMNINDRKKYNIYDVAIYKMNYCFKNDCEKIDECNNEKSDEDEDENDKSDLHEFDLLLLKFTPTNIFEYSNETNNKNKMIIDYLKPYLKSDNIDMLLNEFEKSSTNAIALCIFYIDAKWKNGKSSFAGLHNFKSYGECKIFSGKDIEVVSIPLLIEGMDNKNLEFVMIRPLDGVRYATELNKIGEICRLINIELSERTLFYSCTKSAAFKDIYDSTNLDGLYYYSSLFIDENGKKYNIRMDHIFSYNISISDKLYLIRNTNSSSIYLKRMASQIPTTLTGVQTKLMDTSKNLLKDVKNPLDSLKSNRYKQNENIKNNPLQIHSNFILEAMEKTSCVKISKRWQLALLSNIGFLIVFGIRCNFGAAKNRMAKNYTDPWGNHHVTLMI
uniref:GOLD domain-containing protein n=1 Tax=Strongyloides stercoralis TaxID=6248 RepID=A0AAF5I084_STRER